MSFSEHIQGPARFGGGQEGGPDPQFLRNLLNKYQFWKIEKKLFSVVLTDFWNPTEGPESDTYVCTMYVSR